MWSQLSLGAFGVAVVIGAHSLVNRPATTVRPASIQPEEQGHLILQVEGNIKALRITQITPKKDPYNRVFGSDSPYSVVVLDAGGKKLGEYPLDLSHFDLDPARVGQPIRVEGCEVRDPQIATLVNIPRFEKASFLEIHKGALVLGELRPWDYLRMITAGRPERRQR